MRKVLSLHNWINSLPSTVRAAILQRMRPRPCIRSFRDVGVITVLIPVSATLCAMGLVAMG